MKIKYLLLLILFSITSALNAADWRYGVVRGSDNNQVDIDYQTIRQELGLIIFEVRFPPEKNLTSLFTANKFIRETYAVECSKRKAKFLGLSEELKNGSVKVKFLRTLSDAESADIPEGSMLYGLQEKICREFSTTTIANNIDKGSNAAFQPLHISVLAPNGIVQGEWIAITESGDTKYFAKKHTHERNGDIVTFITGRDLGSELTSKTGNKFRFMVETSIINCQTNMYSSGDTELFNSNGVFTEKILAGISEKTPHPISGEVGKKYKELMCQINTSGDEDKYSNESAKNGKFATGTAWQISKTHLITAFHVVDNVKSIAIMINDEDVRLASIVNFDKNNDLAILKIDGAPLKSKSISLAQTQTKIGSKIAVLGFPIPELLGTKLQANTGEISAQYGLRNDPRFYRITANVQGGNSGGPVLNQYGEAIGVVSSKLNDLATLKDKGELPQNVNFAVKNHYLKSLLETAQIKTSINPKKLKPIDDVIDEFKDSVFLVVTETQD